MGSDARRAHGAAVRLVELNGTGVCRVRRSELVVLAVLLAASAAAVVVGVAMLSAAAGWIAAGVLGGVWAGVFFLQVPGERR